MSSSDDPFDELLNLEEEYYREGYEEGLRDGAESGRIEGYSLGLRKGFEKFVEAGRLQSKAVVWANRIPKYQQRRQNHQPANPRQDDDTSRQEEDQTRVSAQPAEGEDKPREGGLASLSTGNSRQLPPIHSNPRLEKNIELLYGILEPGTLSTSNDDEAVNDFDSRMKGAQGKVRLIERALGEAARARASTTLSSPPAKNGDIEDTRAIRRPGDSGATDL
ncbi:hypothetical protein F4777DRAFT_577279 [Nemania sp. FL0916]|nr:hypothetical protein F4777DRAFT_577279 [Nemania sp. FL0916]